MKKCPVCNSKRVTVSKNIVKLCKKCGYRKLDLKELQEYIKNG